jgi:acyl-CoA thioester hydrolase
MLGCILRGSTMTTAFMQRFEVGWGDLDFNGHMRNTAYLDYAATTRWAYFRSLGLQMKEFQQLRFGPVVLKDEVEYFRELHLLQTVFVGIALAGLSEDGVRFRLRNEFHGEDGRPVARVTSTGAWMDLEARRLGTPPPALRGVLTGLGRTDDFAVIAGKAGR